ncbi:MAG: hypothetical protein C0594_13190 [Marinilabiliales bacterium]|nr:MAG: hypothetical protein C0594_13190 [Marinilabiliales bacterium]
MWLGIALVLLVCIPFYAKSQCFSSPGNPIGGTANMGTVGESMLRIAAFYKYTRSDQYFEGGEKTDYKLVDKARYNFLGLTLGYGITKKLTIENETGYFLEKFQEYNFANYTQQGYGLSNALLSIKYAIYSNPEKRFEWSAGLGSKIPLRKSAQVIDGVEQHIDVQPSTGSYGIVFQNFLIKENSFTGTRFFLINRFEYNFENPVNYFNNGVQYKFGNAYYTSFFVSKHLWFSWTKGDGAWTAIAQLRNETRQKRKENGDLVAASGNSIFYFSPQINITLFHRLNFSTILDIPLYQYYNEIQLGSGPAIMLNLSFDLFGEEW